MSAPVDVLAIFEEIATKKDPFGDFEVAATRYEEARAAVAELIAAHRALLDRYVGLVNSGDAGNWDPETEPDVIASRAALARIGGAA